MKIKSANTSNGSLLTLLICWGPDIQQSLQVMRDADNLYVSNSFIARIQTLTSGHAHFHG